MPVRIKEKITTIQVEDISVEVVRKSVKNLRMSIHPPFGKVRISVPFPMTDTAITKALSDRLPWIRKHLSKLQTSRQMTGINYIDGETHLFLGQNCRLSIIQHIGKEYVVQNTPGSIDLYVKLNSTKEQREEILFDWYRAQLKSMIPDLISKWEPIVRVHANEWGIKRMKTRWGSCNIIAKRIWLNLELTKHPIHCIEYVIVHELVHLHEPGHNARFYSLMTQFIPQWKEYRKELNQSIPENWEE